MCIFLSPWARMPPPLVRTDLYKYQIWCPVVSFVFMHADDWLQYILLYPSRFFELHFPRLSLERKRQNRHFGPSILIWESNLSFNFQKSQYSSSTVIFWSNLSFCYIYCIITWDLCKKSSLPLSPSPSKFLYYYKKIFSKFKQISLVAWAPLHLGANITSVKFGT